MSEQEQNSQNGQDFTQDVKDGEDVQMNGNGNSDNQNGPPARDDDRKLFVGGLSWETTEKELRDHFGQYGEIENINVKTDPNTGRSRGFAFIVYKSAEALDKVSNAGDHIINNKKVDPKKAKARHGKIFIGGLTPEISDDEIKTFFGQFGNIVEVEMPFDKQKNQRKAFCFITFDSEQVVNELLKTPKQTIAGKEVDVKRATPKDGNAPGGFPMGPGGRFQRGAGPRGGPGGRGGKFGGQWGNQGYPPYGQYGGGQPPYYEGYGYNQGYYDYDQYGGYYSGYPNYEYGDYNYGGGYGGRSGPRGGGKGGPGFQGKQRGGRPQRHQPY
ncbi:RNA-binding protein squid isoform X2 [Culicoides brevitarsis]|uniref:RNA-binding protein squid isoform X2 n=1 Tax=Culicoides brevitarsis TaxID=469753 RepID=UPI00307B229F